MSLDNRGPYGVVYRRWWLRPDVQALSFHAKAVYVYAKTSPAGGLVGILPLRPEDVRDDLGLGPRLAERALGELATAGFIRRERGWIWIVDALADTPGIRVGNEKHRTAALKALAHVPDNLAFACRKLYGLNAEPQTEADTNPKEYPDHGDASATNVSHKEEGMTDCPGCGRDSCEGCDSGTVVSLDERLALLRRQAEEITALADGARRS